MTRVISVLVLYCFGLVAAQKTAYVFPIMGGYNAIGFNNDGGTQNYTSDGNILQTSCCFNNVLDNSKCQLIVAQDPLRHNCTSDYLNSNNIGFGMSFARSFRSQINPNDLIILVPCGVGNSGFVDGQWTAYTGCAFIAAQQRTQKTFELLAQDYPSYRANLTAILWQQGTKDADAGSSATNYLNNGLIPMICAWRDTSVLPQTYPELPFLAGNIVPLYALDPNHPERLGVFSALSIVQQYVLFTVSISSVGLIGDPTEGINGQNAANFTAASQINIGQCMAAALPLARLYITLGQI